jgi:2-hydroxychromene-2-carboxylate isomerase
MPHIDYFFSTVSPFTYLAGTRLEEIAARHDATVQYKPLDIIALFGRTGGTAPKDRHPSRQEYRLQELRRQAAKARVPMNLKPAFWPTNPAPSSYAVIAAQAALGKGATGDLGALVAGFTRACWAEERDIADDAVVRDVLTAAGFDSGLADSGLLLGAETYAANLEEAAGRGAFGAPFYITDTDERFWGQDRLDDLDLHLAGRI